MRTGDKILELLKTLNSNELEFVSLKLNTNENSKKYLMLLKEYLRCVESNQKPNFNKLNLGTPNQVKSYKNYLYNILTDTLIHYNLNSKDETFNIYTQLFKIEILIQKGLYEQANEMRGYLEKINPYLTGDPILLSIVSKKYEVIHSLKHPSDIETYLTTLEEIVQLSEEYTLAIEWEKWLEQIVWAQNGFIRKGIIKSNFWRDALNNPKTNIKNLDKLPAILRVYFHIARHHIFNNNNLVEQGQKELIDGFNFISKIKNPSVKLIDIIVYIGYDLIGKLLRISEVQKARKIFNKILPYKKLIEHKSSNLGTIKKIQTSVNIYLFRFNLMDRNFDNSIKVYENEYDENTPIEKSRILSSAILIKILMSFTYFYSKKIDKGYKLVIDLSQYPNTYYPILWYDTIKVIRIIYSIEMKDKKLAKNLIFNLKRKLYSEDPNSIQFINLLMSFLSKLADDNVTKSDIEFFGTVVEKFSNNSFKFSLLYLFDFNYWIESLKRRTQ